MAKPSVEINRTLPNPSPIPNLCTNSTIIPRASILFQNKSLVLQRRKKIQLEFNHYLTVFERILTNSFTVV